MSANAPETPTPLASIGTHRRQTFFQIVLPVGGGIVVFALIITAILTLPFLLREPEQVAAVANVLAILFLILPMIICLLPIYLLMMVLAFGAGTLHNASAKQLRRAQRFSKTVTDKTIDVTETVNTQTINLRVKIAGAEAAMDKSFRNTSPNDHSEQPNNNEIDDNRDHDDTTTSK